MASAKAELRGKIKEYGNFIAKNLQPQLQTAVEAREETEAEISEYIQLQNKLRELQHNLADPSKSSSDESIDTIVDIAHATIYCKANVPNPRTVYVNIGFGFHIEMKIQEAISFIDKRVGYLEKDVLKHRFEAAATVANDVEKALELLQDMGESLGEMEEATRR